MGSLFSVRFFFFLGGGMYLFQEKRSSLNLNVKCMLCFDRQEV